jgi:hypothetical protein
LDRLANDRFWAEANPSQFPVDANIANAQRKVINNKIYGADATNSPTINQSSPHRRTGMNPMVVDEDCASHTMQKALVRTRVHRGRRARGLSQDQDLNDPRVIGHVSVTVQKIEILEAPVTH